MKRVPLFQRSGLAMAMLCLTSPGLAQAQLTAPDAAGGDAVTEQPAAALAETAVDPAPAAAADTKGGAGIEEIVVTSQHREEKLKNVPIAITAATAEQMQAQGVTDAFDIGKITPSFSTNREVGFGTPFMRGVGTTNVLAGDEPSVATYIDGFYQGLGIAAQLPFNNVERVEVLKGPQGTLYGRNAVGGLVNIVTRKPSADTGVEGSVGYGNYDTFSSNAYVTGALGEHVAADFAVTQQDQSEGYSRELNTGKHFGTNDYVALRSKLLFDLGDTDTLLIGFDYANSKDNTANVNSPAPGSLPLEHGEGVLYGQKRSEFAANIDPRFDVKQFGATATLDLDFDSSHFVSLTQYRRLKAIYNVEGDGTSSDGTLVTTQLGVTPGLPADSPLTPQTIVPASFYYISKQSIPYFFTQEFQLLSKDAGPFKWITGSYVQASQDGYDPLNLYFSTQAPALASIDRDQATLALAAFAQGTYTFDNGLSITEGARYSAERKSIDGTVSQLNGDGGYDSFGGEQSTWFRSFTFRLAADYHVNEDLMIYGTVNKGFKSGLFNEQNIGEPAIKPETLYAYEIGFKANPNGMLRLDGSVYYYDYNDLQTFVVGSDGLSHLQNAGGARMYGAELTLEAAPMRGLSLRGGVGLEHATYTDFADAEVFLPSPSGGNYPVSEDVSGNDVIRTPKFTGNAGASYTFDVGGAGYAALNASIAYSGRYAWDVGNQFHQGGYALVDLSAKYTTTNDRWSLTLWGKNVTDKEYLVYRNITQRFDAVAWGNPATYGATVGFKF